MLVNSACKASRPHDLDELKSSLSLYDFFLCWSHAARCLLLMSILGIVFHQIMILPLPHMRTVFLIICFPSFKNQTLYAMFVE